MYDWPEMSAANDCFRMSIGDRSERAGLSRAVADTLLLCGIVRIPAALAYHPLPRPPRPEQLPLAADGLSVSVR